MPAWTAKRCAKRPEFTPCHRKVAGRFFLRAMKPDDSKSHGIHSRVMRGKLRALIQFRPRRPPYLHASKNRHLLQILPISLQGLVVGDLNACV